MTTNRTGQRVVDTCGAKVIGRTVASFLTCREANYVTCGGITDGAGLVN